MPVGSSRGDKQSGRQRCVYGDGFYGPAAGFADNARRYCRKQGFYNDFVLPGCEVISLFFDMVDLSSTSLIILNEFFCHDV